MDKVTFRILLLSLATFEILLIAGAIFLMYEDKTIPDWQSVAMGSIVTGMLGLAVHQNADEPVQVINPPGDTIDVTAAPAHRADAGVDTLN